ncbi:MAG: GNAT family N-acetyltransferase [Pseudomonadota bacterium]|nr:GNAT family N-acetyltransferase [Actinomycetota bacterium]
MSKINPEDVSIRMLRNDDFSAIVEIDSMVGKKTRPQYYERKLRRLTDSSEQIVSSLVAEHGGRVVGFLMGEVYHGEFGIPESQAAIDTIGVDPRAQRSGIAEMLFEEFVTNMKAIGVTSIRTLINWNDFSLAGFFNKVGFSPTPVLNLELKI